MARYTSKYFQNYVDWLAENGSPQEITDYEAIRFLYAYEHAQLPIKVSHPSYGEIILTSATNNYNTAGHIVKGLVSAKVVNSVYSPAYCLGIYEDNENTFYLGLWEE